MKTLFVSLTTATALLVGCESTPHYKRTKIVQLSGTPITKADRKPYGSVKLFQSKEEAPAKYDVIALMSVEGKAGEEAAFIKAFLYRAADLGADAIILYRVSMAAGVDGGGMIVGKNGGFSLPTNLRQDAFWRAEAIRVPPPATSAQAPVDQTARH